jgi:putative ABC transport system permease protein
MKPLSIFKYYINNKKRFIPVFTAIFLGGFLLYTMQMLVDSSYKTVYTAYVEPQKYYSLIKARGSMIAPGTDERIRKWDTVDRVLPVVFHYTNINAVIEQTGTQVLAVNAAEIGPLMSLMKLTLKEGRLPSADAQEIILHHLVARNKNLKIGDWFGSDVDGGETLTGKYKVVGILEGSTAISFFPMEPFVAKYGIPYPERLGMILIPKEGKLEAMNEALEKLDSTGIEIRTLDFVRAQHESGKYNVNLLLNLISISIILIVAVCMGFLCYIYYFQRRRELGLLNAIGFSSQEIINRAFAEIGVMSFAGYAAGLSASILTGLALKFLLFLPSGQILQLVNPDYFVRSFCIPLFVTLFGVLPVWRMLKRLDPISMIEGKGDSV